MIEPASTEPWLPSDHSGHSLESIPDVCEVERVVATSASSAVRPSLLIEVPHGATQRRHFEATRRRLAGDLPADLDEFFFVNTDVGSIECARFIAGMLVNPGGYPEMAALEHGGVGADRRTIDSVLIVRGLVARTFVDLNRVISPPAPVSSPSTEEASPIALTPSLPTYVTRPDDIAALLALHADYQAVAKRAFGAVCDAAGSDPAALILHTYAPRTVEIAHIDDGIVAALRHAYEPAVFQTLERRPDVDLITEATDGRRLAPPVLVRAARERYAQIGIKVTENATYRLHESSMGYVHSARYPGRVLCAEINRELLADPFTPFAEMSISEPKARRMAAPIAAALLTTLTEPGDAAAA